ncbi:MAG: glutamate--tRNA ligase [Candidatus Kerfeldbacteria bacterium]|nr:glutamate--tRNA ligase [Candidatus Kerfeldbacteria bacterium]
MTVRTRFAPSPTGLLHIGGLRTALYNWLYARKHGGQFVLRIEDTDRGRLLPEATGQISESLRWAGLNYDEGPDIGGPYGPYVQSERLALYREHAEKLTANHAAYYCFCSPERLQQVRDEQAARKEPPRYDRQCRGLTPEEVRRRLDAATSYVLRIKLPEQGSVVVDDLVRGRVEFRYDTLDDSVLLKSDGYPTYHLAVVVDDHQMRISHVLRAEEWLPSTPKHLFLYDAFGWERPAFAHLSLLLSPDGGKLSKRDGATSVLEYRDLGYLPEALINFLALLGWNPKTDREWFTRDELVEAFSLEGIQKAGAVFDRKKLDHMNGVAIRGLSATELLARAGERGQPLVEAFGDRASAALALVQDRIVTLNDITKQTGFLLKLPDYDQSILVPKKGSRDKTIEILEWLQKYFATHTEKSRPAADLSADLQQELQKQGWTNAEALWPLRVAVSGQKNSPGVFEIAEVLGSNAVQQRLRVARNKLNT